MSTFRRRLMAMQKKDSIDWDYEWSYLSGELPNDERFIQSIYDCVMENKGLRMYGWYADITLVDRDKFDIYVKFDCLFKTDNNDRKGFSIRARNNDIETPDICFSSKKKEESNECYIYYLGGEGNHELNTQETYNPNIENEAIIKFDLRNGCTFDMVVNGKSIKGTNVSKTMWFRNKTSIGTRELSSVNYVYLKELKIKVYDS